MNKRLVAIIAAVCVIGYYFYQAPEQVEYSNNFIGALKAAEELSSAIRRGQKLTLIAAADGAAESRLEVDPLPSLKDIAIWSELRKPETVPPMHHYLWAPVTAKFARPSDSVELLRMERAGIFYTMTFRGLIDDWSSTTVYLDKQPMLISVAIRYYSGGNDSEFHRLLRKFANIEWMPLFINKLGEKGRWLLSDYRYTFTNREYYDWVKANGPRLHAQAQEDSNVALERFKEKDYFDKMKERVSKQLEIEEDWASQNLEQQILDVRQQLEKSAK